LKKQMTMAAALLVLNLALVVGMAAMLMRLTRR
jgi:hypothetical protein